MTQPCNSCSSREAVSGGLCGVCETEQMRLGRLDYPAHAQHSDNPRPDSGRRHEQRVRDTRQHLGELPDLYTLLPTFRLPGSAPKDPEQRTGKSNPARRSVVNLDVIDLTDPRLKDDAEDMRTDYDLDRRAGARRQGVVNTLAAWSRLVDSERREQDLESDLADDPTISSECAYLLKHLDWFAAQPSGFIELHDEVKQLRTDVRRAIGDRDEILSLPCLVCSWQMVGQGDYDAERQRYPWYRCSGCGKTITTQAELDRAEQQASDLVTLRYAAERVGRPLSTLKEWCQRGWISSDKRDKRGSLYSVAAVRKVAESIEHGRQFRPVA